MLSGAPPSSAGGQREVAAPFESMLSAISATRSLSAAPSDDERLAAADAAAREAEMNVAAEEAAVARNERLQVEAAALLREAIIGVEAWARRTAAQESSGNTQTADARGAGVDEPDWELLGQRAQLLGGEVGDSLSAALKTVESDFVAFRKLQEGGQLPTLVEQLSEPLDAASAQATLGAFRGQSQPAQQRLARNKRRKNELEAKQLRLGAAASACKRSTYMHRN